MSVECLLEAVRDHLREQLDLANDQCDVTPEGRPIPACGEFYIGIDDGGVDSTATSHFSERVRVNVMVTVRTGKYPTDRRGSSLYLRNLKGLNPRCRAVIDALHGNYSVISAANDLLEEADPEAYGFQLPLSYSGSSPATPRTGDWAHSTRDDDTFLVKALSFTGALLVRPLPSDIPDGALLTEGGFALLTEAGDYLLVE